MERQYRILSYQSTDVPGRAIYCLLQGREKSVRIQIDRRADWEVGMTIKLDEAFVEVNKEL